ncbi:MAG: DUF4364 family protein [Lachnospiraceae bacterium]|nr:DUF4364 family protein [Lachnospiraceae bacterium]
MAEPVTLYKLIVLYMLSKADFPLTDSQLSDFILGQGYTDYIILHQVFSDLEESDMIRSEIILNNRYYSMTDAGAEALKFFHNRISPAIRSDIDQYMVENKMKLRDEVSVLADYYKNTDGDYSVHCYVKEKLSRPIDMTFSVPYEEQAKKACRNWQEHSQRIYEFIIKELL